MVERRIIREGPTRDALLKTMSYEEVINCTGCRYGAHTDSDERWCSYHAGLFLLVSERGWCELYEGREANESA